MIDKAPPPKPTLKAAPATREPLFIGRHADSGLVVFLDFDGVLHPLGPGNRRFANAPVFLASLRSMQALGARPSLALSTTWRFQPMALILSELDKAAPGLASFVEGRCGRIEPSEAPSWLGSRHAEILDYCQARAHGPAPRFAIVDDQASLFGPGHAPSALLLCNPALGFTAHDGARLASIAIAR